jgi:hypothetical protein
MGNGGRRFGVRGVGERRSGMVLGLQRGQTSSPVLMSLQMRFSSGNRRLCCIVFWRTAAGCARRRGGDNGLPGVAHFLHRRRRSAAEQTGDTDQDKNEPQHSVQRH